MMISSHENNELLNYLFTIGKIVSQFTEQKAALDEISHLLQDFLKFNYLLIHQLDDHNQAQVIYSRSAGECEPEVELYKWEDVLANLVLTTQQSILQQPSPKSKDVPDNAPHFLGIPLLYGQKCLGGFILIRYGGPVFTKDDVNIAEFIGQQITLMMVRFKLNTEHDLLELQRQQARLQEDFISTITHDLRNPLGVIKGYSTTLLRTDINWDQKTQHDFLQIIDQETDRLREMIDNLMDSSRMQEGRLNMEFQLLRLETVIKDVIVQNQRHFPDLKINLDYPELLAPIIADPHRLAQVFDNLIGNVVKHAPKSDISITIKQEKAGVNIAVQDYGQGIPEQYLPKIFERFFRVPENAPNVHGSGVGLFICKQIVQAHHGKISATSIVGKGTTIHIFLPFKP